MTALTTPPAGEEGERVKARLDGLLQGGDITPYAFDEICMWLDRLSSPRVEEERRMREALLISRGFVVAALEAHPDMKGLDVNDHLVVREIDAALSPQGG